MFPVTGNLPGASPAPWCKALAPASLRHKYLSNICQIFVVPWRQMSDGDQDATQPMEVDPHHEADSPQLSPEEPAPRDAARDDDGDVAMADTQRARAPLSSRDPDHRQG